MDSTIEFSATGTAGGQLYEFKYRGMVDSDTAMSGTVEYPVFRARGWPSHAKATERRE